MKTTSKTKDQLIEDLRTFSLVVEQSPASTIILSRDLKIEYVNPACEEATGYSAEELIGKHIDILRSGEHSPGFYEAIWAKAGLGAIWRGDVCSRRKDGEKIWELISISPVKSPDGEITRFLSVKVDDTERKQAEEELETIFNLSPDMVCSGNLEGYFTKINPSFEQTLGYKEEELLKRPFIEFVHDEDVEKTKEAIAEALAGKRDFYIDNRYKCKDGSIKWIAWTVLALTAENKFIAVGKDVTERKEAEERLKASLKEKEVLLKEIHHRVKNNLQVVSSILNLQSGYIEDKKLQGIFKESQDRIRSMALVHEQLYQTRDLSNISISGYLKGLVANIFKSYAHAPSKVELKMEIEDIKLDIDTSIVLGLIVNELFTNALKYAFVEGREGELRVEFARTDKDNCLLTISDNGVGLPEGLEVDKSESMGFLLVKSMVAQIDGTLKIEADKGTSFKITFPGSE